MRRGEMDQAGTPPLRTVQLPGLGKIHCFRGAEHETRFIHREIFEEREYAPAILKWQPGMTIVDVGANIGLFSLFAHQQCQGDCRIVCFEPIPPTYGVLQKNLGDRGWLQDGTITMVNAGLTRFDGPQTLKFLFFPLLPGNSTACQTEKSQEIDALKNWSQSPDGLNQHLVQKQKWSGWFTWLMSPMIRWISGKLLQKAYLGVPVTCQLTTLTAACETHGIKQIDLLKIDVEGAEWDVLQGMSDSLWSGVQQVVMEAHDVDDRIEQIRQLLRSRGFQQIEVVRPAFAEGIPVNNVNIYATRVTAGSIPEVRLAGDRVRIASAGRT